MTDINVMALADIFTINKNHYPNQINTERLVLHKGDTDCVTVLYSICMNSEKQEKIGEIVLVFDGEIWYKMNEEYQNKGYMTEALTSVLEVSNKNHYLSIEHKNKASRKVAKKLGFQKTKKVGNTHIYRKNT